ncbi:hypothetical protein [Streptomyces sp. NBC_00996]|uniref:hypothetical protein n=1 Tax=Streptomyces sp. NBC_00996 TaxID=2903710 RepID=UPI00386C8F01|nr:hypothetical protein OG390_08385 [Streptomyces sp. NBC_00996]
MSDAVWSGLCEHLDEQEFLELLVLAGWYRTIAYVANGARIEEEPWALALPGTTGAPGVRAVSPTTPPRAGSDRPSTPAR